MQLALIPADQQAAVARPDALIALQTTIDRVFGRLARDLIENMKYLGERAAPCCLIVPAGQTLSDRVEIGDSGRRIRGDDSIPDAGQGDTEQLLFRTQDVVGLCQLCGALLDFAFQVVIRATQRVFSAPPLLHLPFQLAVDRLLAVARRSQIVQTAPRCRSAAGAIRSPICSGVPKSATSWQ